MRLTFESAAINWGARALALVLLLTLGCREPVESGTLPPEMLARASASGKTPELVLAFLFPSSGCPCKYMSGHRGFVDALSQPGVHFAYFVVTESEEGRRQLAEAGIDEGYIWLDTRGNLRNHFHLTGKDFPYLAVVRSNRPDMLLLAARIPPTPSAQTSLGSIVSSLLGNDVESP